jgi:DNA-binding NarL/FixJ family response regulator
MTGPASIRVALADDHQMVRQALAQLLEESAGIQVVGQAGDGDEAVKLVEATSPDVIVLDYSMPAMDAPGTIQSLLRRHRQLKVVVLTVHESIHYAVRVLESGAHGYVVKSAAAQELVEAIRAAHRDEVYISPKVSQRVIQQLRRPKTDRVGVSALSPREFELLRVLGSGMSLKECAGHLNITISTASTYRARLMEKLNLHSTAEIIRFALENEIVG